MPSFDHGVLPMPRRKPLTLRGARRLTHAVNGSPPSPSSTAPRVHVDRAARDTSPSKCAHARRGRERAGE
jgi:hypothetical protein